MMKRLLAMVLAFCLLMTTAFAVDIATPSDLTTPEPSAPATAAPVQSDAPAWDESTCDHANLNCTKAPACDKPGCAHIAQDVNGLPYPLCQKGRWVLDQQDQLLREGMTPADMQGKTVRNDVIDLNKADAVIYRSGSYVVTGGDKRPGAQLTVAENRVVVMTLRNTSMEAVTLKTNVNATVLTVGQNQITTWTAEQDTATQFTSGGALVVDAWVRPDAAEDHTTVSVTGGSVHADFAEIKGRTMQAFNAAGVTSVLVDGAAVLCDTADADGKIYLWLEQPGGGMRWQGQVSGNTLLVTRVSSGSVDNVVDVSSGQIVTAQSGSNYRIHGQMAPGTALHLIAPVTVILSDAAISSAVLVDGGVPVTLTLQGNSSIRGNALPGSVTMEGEGALHMDSLNAADLTMISGRLVLDTLIPGTWSSGAEWVHIDAAEDLTLCDKLTVDGIYAPLVTCGSELLLPALADRGYVLESVADHQIKVRTVSLLDQVYTMNADGTLNVGSETAFTVIGGGAYVTGEITASGAMASGTLENVQVQGNGAVLHLTDEQLTLTLKGDNGFVGLGSADAVSLDAPSTLTLDVTQGRLLMKRQADLSGITLLGNVKVEPEPTTPHVRLMIRDRNGNPVLNTPITLMVNGHQYQYITHYDGSVYLWGLGSLNQAEVAATDGTEVYTTVLMNGEGEAITGLNISNVKAEDQADGSIIVTFTCPGAASVGVMYVTGTGAQQLPDAYAASAKLQAGASGKVTLTGIGAGEVVSYRVYASNVAGAVLNADTYDGFQFGESMAHSHRVAWSSDENADAVYTSKAYVNPLKLPESFTVTYTGAKLDSDGMPVQVGDYVMHVTVPEGDAAYLPGTYDKTFAITKVDLIIIPDDNQEKYEGDEDPYFFYDVRGLLGDDYVDGELLREPGETVGNYNFLLTGLIVPTYYRLKLANGAAVFTILPAENNEEDKPPVFYEMLHPVRQTIVRKDGRTVSVLLNTQEKLTVTHSVVGQVMFATSDDQVRPVSPSLTWNKDTDEVLLRLHGEAELNKDGGYVTDEDGKPQWGGRFVRMSWLALRNLHDIGVDGLSLTNHGATLAVRLEDFLSQDMQAFVKQQGGDLKQVRFRLTVEAVVSEGEEAAAVSTLSPVTSTWRMRVSLLIDRQEIDVTDRLPSLQGAISLEATAKLMASVNRYDEAAFPTQFTMAQVTEEQGSYTGAAITSAYVKPFMPEELTLVDFPALCYIDRYIVASLTKSGLVCVRLK